MTGQALEYWMPRLKRGMTVEGLVVSSASREAKFPFSVAFAFGCDLLKNESRIAEVKRRSPGNVFWIGFLTSPSLEAVSMAAASHAMRRAAATLFSFVK